MISGLKFIVETPIPKANNLKVTIGVAELVSWTISRSGGFKTPQLAAESVSKACLVVHTRDSNIGLNAPGANTGRGRKLQDRNLILIKLSIRKGLFCQKKKFPVNIANHYESNQSHLA